MYCILKNEDGLRVAPYADFKNPGDEILIYMDQSAERCAEVLKLVKNG